MKDKKFDHGVAGNIKNYQEQPDYNLDIVSIPLQLYYGTNDIVTNVQVRTALIANLQSVYFNRFFPVNEFTGRSGIVRRTTQWSKIFDRNRQFCTP